MPKPSKGVEFVNRKNLAENNRKSRKAGWLSMLAYRATVNANREQRSLNIIEAWDAIVAKGKELLEAKKAAPVKAPKEPSKSKASKPAIAAYFAALEQFEKVKAMTAEVSQMAKAYVALPPVDAEGTLPVPTGLAQRFYFQAYLEMEAVKYKAMVAQEAKFLNGLKNMSKELAKAEGDAKVAIEKAVKETAENLAVAVDNKAMQVSYLRSLAAKRDAVLA